MRMMKVDVVVGVDDDDDDHDHEMYVIWGIVGQNNNTGIQRDSTVTCWAKCDVQPVDLGYTTFSNPFPVRFQ